MLKILIVDDEAPTRMRIIKGIDWEEFNISQIIQAEDGEEALHLCDTFIPDILLTDVRMPKTDGIELATRLTQRFPGIKTIFVSGYTDKEYFKSAIRLGAVSYIEKPVDLGELKDVLAETVSALNNDRSTAHKIKAFEQSRNLQKLMEVAGELCQPSFYNEQLLEELVPEIRSASLFVTVVAKIAFSSGSSDLSSFIPFMFQSIYEISDVYDAPSLSPLCTCKGNHIIIHLAGQSTGSNFTDYKMIDQYCNFVVDKLSGSGINSVVAVGTVVSSWKELARSYETAVVAVQQSFYQESDSVCYYKKTGASTYQFTPEQVEIFSQTLKKQNRNHALLYIHNLTGEIKQFQNTLVINVLRHYYALICELMRLAQDEQITLYEKIGKEQDVWVHIQNFSFITQLEDFLVQGINQYYDSLNEGKYGNATVDRIVKFIKNNYANPDLSITAISEYTNLSPTYICHLFKDTTKMTINNFILNYRMQKAQQLLKDPVCKVKEVGFLVGYRNGNYFSYQFKKFTGLSPSQFREKTI